MQEKKLIDKLVAGCTGIIDEVKIAEYNSIERSSAECNSVENVYKCSSCTLYIVLFSIIFTTNIGIATYFVYYKYMNQNKENVSRYDYVYQSTNY